FGGRVPGCALQDLPGIDVRDLGRRGRPGGRALSKREAGHGNSREGDEHEPLHNAETPGEGRGYGLEEIAELEVQLPAGCRPAAGVDLVEAVGVVDAEATERRNHRRADTDAPDRASGLVRR